jgi:hypothetical protein
LIENRWNKLGGCNPAAKNPMGDPRGPEIRNPYTGGLSQDFEHGQIVVYDRWAAGSAGQMANFVLLAYVNNLQVHVEWGDTAPFSYDLFNVRWDFDGLPDEIKDQHKSGLNFSTDPQQDSIGGGSSGSFDFKAGATGVLRIYVEGCDDGLLSNTCRQGFSYPVTIDVAPEAPTPQLAMKIPASNAGAETPTQPVKPTPLSDAPGDGAAMDDDSATQITESICDASDVIASSGDHEGELDVNVAIALLRKAQDMTIQCRGLPDPSYQTDPVRFRVWLNEKIRQAKVVSDPGTESAFLKALVGGITGIAIALLVVAAATLVASWLWLTYSAEFAKIATALGIAAGAVIGFLLCDTHGDYDMRLVRLIQISYLYDSVLEQSTKDHIRNDLLTVKGPASDRKEHVWFCYLPTIIPESENHILMTESSRYLTNQLIAEDATRKGQPIPSDNDNDANGMNDWFLGHLQGFMQNDFYEYNARPYTGPGPHGDSESRRLCRVSGRILLALHLGDSASAVTAGMRRQTRRENRARLPRGEIRRLEQRPSARRAVPSSAGTQRVSISLRSRERRGGVHVSRVRERIDDVLDPALRFADGWRRGEPAAGVHRDLQAVAGDHRHHVGRAAVPVFVPAVLFQSRKTPRGGDLLPDARLFDLRGRHARRWPAQFLRQHGGRVGDADDADVHERRTGQTGIRQHPR